MSEKLSLNSSLVNLKGVGPAKYKLLAESGLSTVADLLDYWPRRYVDYSKLSLIKDVQPGLITLKVKISSIKGRWARGRAMHLTEAIVEDEAGDRMPVVWFNQPFRLTSFKNDEDYFLSGEFKVNSGRLNLTNPTVEPVKDENGQANTARIIPIYPERSNLNSKLLRSLILQVKNAVDQIPETLPQDVLQEYKLISKAESIWQLHMPESMESLSLAKRRLAFEEILTLQLAVQKNKQFIQKLKAPKIKFNLDDTKELVSSLKFKLTDDQRKVSWQILQDLEKFEPMNRMLMGDVGSGKTVVAALAALQAIKAGKQVVVLTPTEVLARQHHKSFNELLKSLGAEVKLLVGSLKPNEKREILEQIEKGRAELIVGTHALLQEKVKFKNLSLVIVDEQHRFGVNQRKELQKRVKEGHFPHLLTMTATPIPRSLALILYGELEQSVLKTKPPGRIEINTKLIPGASKQKVWDKMKEELSLGHAVIFVCPAITDSEASKRVSAEKVFAELSKKAWVKKHGLGLLHGKLKADEKEQIMSDFASGKTNILVSTTVIEVGIDVPRATLMIIEGAEYFGLAQLHQLRGRVGRSNLPSFCYLVPVKNDGIPARLRYFAENSDGFKLAQYDLEMRGPGQIYRKLQSGALDLRLVDITDLSLVKKAKEAAQEILNKKLTLSKELKANIQKHQDLEYLN
jgi:ATP-dependent DNA helicase RecG